MSSCTLQRMALEARSKARVIKLTVLEELFDLRRRAVKSRPIRKPNSWAQANMYPKTDACSRGKAISEPKRA